MLHPIDAFRDALASAGLRTDEQFIDDGKIHRFTIAGDKPRSKNGWYVLHGDGVPAGAFGSWKHDISASWCAKADHELTHDERRQYAQRMDEARRQRANELANVRSEAKLKANAIWKAAPDAQDDHPYLVAKRIKAHRLKLAQDGRLIVSVTGPDKQIQSLQFIDDTGGKRFLPGGLMTGGYFKIGESITETVLIAEGYATGASLHEATGLTVAVAFNANNLQPVCNYLREALPPHVKIEIRADNDNKQTCLDCGGAFDVNQHPEICPECGCEHKRKNTGLQAAAKAAEAIGATVVAPEHGGDWNDVAIAEGYDALRDAKPANDNMATEPIDLFAEIPVPPMRREMLPDIIADYAFDQAELVGVEAGMIAMPALVACASALHDGVQLQVKRHEQGWRESARLWCAVVGNPSIKKSPSIKRATSRIRKIDSDMHDTNDKAMAKHLAEMEAYKEAKKEAKKTGESVKTPEQPQRERMVVEDVTVEALSEVLKDNARGVLCLQDELSGWFGSMDAYSGGKAGGKDRAHWLEAYNGGGRVVDRVMRGNLKIPNWSVCMIGGIQPDAIRRIAQNMTDDGLMQRFMIVVGSNAEEYDRDADAPAAKAYSGLVDYLYGVAPSANPVTMTEDAHQVREALNKYAMDLANYPAMPGGLKSHLGKWSGLFARLVLLFHAIECHRMSVHPVSAQVTGDTARRVDMLMRKFLLPHAMAYYTDVLGAATELEHARWIAGHVLSKNLSAVTLRDIQQAYRPWRGLDDWRRTRVMQTLEDMGWLTPVDDDRKSRRGAHTWAVNMAVHDRFAEKAQVEAETRERMREEFLARRIAL